MRSVSWLPGCCSLGAATLPGALAVSQDNGDGKVLGGAMPLGSGVRRGSKNAAAVFLRAGASLTGTAYSCARNHRPPPHLGIFHTPPGL